MLYNEACRSSAVGEVTVLRGGVTKPFFFSVPLNSQVFFIESSNTPYLLKITFIFDRCYRRWVSLAPVKYEYDSNDMTDTIARPKIPLTEKLTNEVLATPIPGCRVVSANVVKFPQLIWRSGPISKWVTWHKNRKPCDSSNNGCEGDMPYCTVMTVWNSPI